MKKNQLYDSCKNLSLYHAINLKDYINYMDMGGVANRRDLISFVKKQEDSRSYTPFWTDSMDDKNGYLSRTFANIYDFNSVFWKNNRSKYFSPCVYGPITIKVAPSIWEDRKLNDIEFTSKTVGSNKPGKKLTPKEVASLSNSQYSSTEVNMDIPIISIDHFEKIIIDPIVINNKYLSNFVRDVTPPVLHQKLIVRDSSRKAQEDFAFIINNFSNNQYEEKLDGPIKKSFKQWKKYFNNGTLSFFYPVTNRMKSAPCQSL